MWDVGPGVQDEVAGLGGVLTESQPQRLQLQKGRVQEHGREEGALELGFEECVGVCCCLFSSSAWLGEGDVAGHRLSQLCGGWTDVSHARPPASHTHRSSSPHFLGTSGTQEPSLGQKWVGSGAGSREPPGRTGGRGAQAGVGSPITEPGRISLTILGDSGPWLGLGLMITGESTSCPHPPGTGGVNMQLQPPPLSSPSLPAAGLAGPVFTEAAGAGEAGGGPGQSSGGWHCTGPEQTCSPRRPAPSCLCGSEVKTLSGSYFLP